MSARLVLLTGKGGVGKSTVAAAMALDAARAGERPLVVELGSARATLPSVLGGAAIGHEPVEMGDGVAAMALDIDRAVVDYLAAQLRFRTLARALASTRALSSFLSAAPAVGEIATFHTLETLLASGRWDPVIVDLDATGHARMLLELPRALDGLMGEGPLRRLLGRTTATLRDSARASVFVVTLPEELPVEETEELVAWLRAEGGVAIGGIVVNQMPPEAIADEGLRALDAIERAASDADTHVDVTLVRRDRSAYENAQKLVARLAKLGLPIATLPRLARLRTDALVELGAVLPRNNGGAS
jgi:anion-transporting  ArsA/GET3 family ATPase